MRKVILPTVSYMGLVRKVEERNNGAILPPINDAELNKIIDSQKYFIAKYKYASISWKSFSTFRDYICESLLGMSHGGYQQLQAIWKAQASLLKAVDNAVFENKEFIGNLPSEIWCFINDSNDLMFSSDPRAVYKKSRCPAAIEDEGFFKEMSEDLEIAILTAYAGKELHLIHPNASKYGLPEILENDISQNISDMYGIRMDDNFDEIVMDSGDDGCGELLFKLIKK